MTGLPELLLYFQETTRSMASQFSSSNIGNGSFSCIPNDWSLLCQTVPYALILLEKDSPEWCDVLTKGGYDIHFLLKILLLYFIFCILI